MGWVGLIWGFSGMNSDGLVHLTNISDTQNNSLAGELLNNLVIWGKLLASGLPAGILGREMLTSCSNVVEAAYYLKTQKAAFGWNILLADKYGDFESVELDSNIMGDADGGFHSYRPEDLDDLIKQIGTLDSIQKSIENQSSSSPEVVDGSQWIVLPGMIDCHTHLLFAGSREKELYMRADGRPYLDILKSGGGIYNTVQAVREASEEQLIQNGLKYLDKAIQMGLTTVEMKSGYGLDYDNEKKMLKVIRQLNDLHPVDVIPTFLVHTVPKEMDRIPAAMSDEI